MSLKYNRLGALGARPIPLPLEELASYVELTLVTKVQDALEVLARSHGDEPIGDRLHLYGGLLYVPSVRGDEVPVKVYVQSQPTSSKSTRYGASLTAGGAYAYESKTIVIFFNGAFTPNGVLQSKSTFSPLRSCTHAACMAFAFYDILIHVLTLAADVFGAPGYDPKKVQRQEESEFAAYYNEPAEVRAYMRQVVEETDRMGEMVKRVSKGKQDLVTKALKFSTTWQGVSPYLTPSNRARILKAVYDRLTQKGLV